MFARQAARPLLRPDSRFDQSSPRRPEGERVEALFTRYRRDGDTAAREELIRRFLPFARKLAYRYSRGTEPLEDLSQVAALGLVKAVDRFDPDHGVPFAGFAVPTITGELRRHFRDHAWSVRLPRSLHDRVMQVEGASRTLSARLGRSPTAYELAGELALPLEAVVEALGAASAQGAASLDAPAATRDGDGDVLAAIVGAEDDGYELAEDRATIASATWTLAPREHEVLRMRFFEDMTQAKIAESLGVSQMQISRIIRGAIARLRENADASRSAG